MIYFLSIRHLDLHSYIVLFLLFCSLSFAVQEVREGRVAELAKVAHADKIRQTKSTELIFR